MALLVLRRGSTALVLGGATLSLGGSLWLLTRVAGGQAEKNKPKKFKKT